MWTGEVESRACILGFSLNSRARAGRELQTSFLVGWPSHRIRMGQGFRASDLLQEQKSKLDPEPGARE